MCQTHATFNNYILTTIYSQRREHSLQAFPATGLLDSRNFQQLHLTTIYSHRRKHSLQAFFCGRAIPSLFYWFFLLAAFRIQCAS